MAAFSLRGGEHMSKGIRKYFGKKIFWFLITLIAAVILNFVLPRLMPSDPVAQIVGKTVGQGADTAKVAETYEKYKARFGLDKSMPEQFLIYVQNLFRGDLGESFYYLEPVADVIGRSIGWTVVLQLPAILVGWILGNLLGALAAYIRKGFDKILMPVSLFLSAIPAFGMAITMLVLYMAFGGKASDVLNGYDTSILVRNGAWWWSAFKHYQMPFWSIVLISIGGQAVGMRSMSIYELNADYVKYARFLGIKDRRIVRYVFRNAMLPQVTGLAMSIGSMIGGALVAETVFSYPGLGTTILKAVTNSDYPLISATTLIITVMVLLAAFMLDIIYAFIDPRVKAAQFD